MHFLVSFFVCVFVFLLQFGIGIFDIISRLIVCSCDANVDKQCKYVLQTFQRYSVFGAEKDWGKGEDENLPGTVWTYVYRNAFIEYHAKISNWIPYRNQKYC